MPFVPFPWALPTKQTARAFLKRTNEALNDANPIRWLSTKSTPKATSNDGKKADHDVTSGAQPQDDTAIHHPIDSTSTKLTTRKQFQTKQPSLRKGFRQTDDDNDDNKKLQAAITASTDATTTFIEHNPLKMYMTCMFIVFCWISTGTIFYAMHNSWPFAQSFFYAVDAGMSIGFCTDVAEVKLSSKAFTIVYIILGASVIGGALALFIQDAVEGLATPHIQEYQVLLEKDVFDTANISQTGVLSYAEFRQLILRSVSMASSSSSATASSSLSSQQDANGNFQEPHQPPSDLFVPTEDDIRQLWNKFDRLKDGVIHFEEFSGTFKSVQHLVQSLKEQHEESLNGLSKLSRVWFKLQTLAKRAWHLEYRIYVVFALWMAMGILWGMFDQEWDPITATHFAVSALATGGLTGPDVDANGILPARPAIFCGIFCLFGIPLFALTLGHYARYLVGGHVAALEQSALTRPITRFEFDFAKRLTTPEDPLVHLSDYIVLQLLRQGKISMEAISVMKHNFDLLDVDQTGKLSFEEVNIKNNNNNSGGNGNNNNNNNNSSAT